MPYVIVLPTAEAAEAFAKVLVCKNASPELVALAQYATQVSARAIDMADTIEQLGKDSNGN